MSRLHFRDRLEELASELPRCPECSMPALVRRPKADDDDGTDAVLQCIACLHCWSDRPTLQAAINTEHSFIARDEWDRWPEPFADDDEPEDAERRVFDSVDELQRAATSHVEEMIYRAVALFEQAKRELPDWLRKAYAGRLLAKREAKKRSRSRARRNE